MTNAELIKALRICDADEEDGHCYENKCPLFGVESKWSDMNCDRKLMRDAADALEAAEKRIAELEAQLPKEGEWIDLFGHDYKCSVCGEWYKMDGTPETEDMNYCPNCGAKMRMRKGEQDGC